MSTEQNDAAAKRAAKHVADAVAALAELKRWADRDAAALTQEEWAALSVEAGKLQRRARQLGGLGRGG